MKVTAMVADSASVRSDDGDADFGEAESDPWGQDNTDDDDDDNGPHQGGGKPNQATLLVQMAEDKYGFGVTPDGKPFAYSLDAQHVALNLKGTQLGLRQRLSAEYYDKFGIAAAQASLAAAMNVLEGKAYNEKPTQLHVRVAGDRKSIYIDMADKQNRVIRIGGGRWDIVTECPYTFRRTQNTGAMEEPKRGGNLGRLFNYLHVAKADQKLVIGLLVDALINPNTAKPITHFCGEHGTAKSGSTTCFASLIDPTVLPHHGPPKDLVTWATTASASWVVALDNISSVPDWLSDAMCRTATGSGLSKRSLYTDDDLSILVFRRAIVMNGIALDKVRGDFADRLVSFELQVIPDEQRLSEEDIAERWPKDGPRILGALLDIAAEVQQALPNLEPQPLPRMADFARVLACIDKLKGVNSLTLYRSRVTRALSDTIGDNPFLAFMVDKRYETPKSGATSSEIRKALESRYPINPRPSDWPRSPKSVTALLKRNAPGLRAAGWSVEDDGAQNEVKSIRWFITPPAAKEDDEGEQESQK
jgi:hypothetical protein